MQNLELLDENIDYLKIPSLSTILCSLSFTEGLSLFQLILELGKKNSWLCTRCIPNQTGKCLWRESGSSEIWDENNSCRFRHLDIKVLALDIFYIFCEISFYKHLCFSTTGVPT